MTKHTDGILSGRRIAVTGTSRGIGRALVGAFTAAGARVLAHARTPDTLPEAEATAVGDLRDPELGPRLAASARDQLGGLDVLFLNAAVLGAMAPLEETDFDVFADVMDINVDAQLRLLVPCLPLLRESRGAVYWMTSYLGHAAVPNYGAYCASKHAMEGLAKLVALEHEDDGIVSVITEPGMVVTDMLKAAQYGADVSMHTPPDAAAAGFARMLAATEPSWSGKLISLSRFL